MLKSSIQIPALLQVNIITYFYIIGYKKSKQNKKSLGFIKKKKFFKKVLTFEPNGSNIIEQRVPGNND